VNRLFIILTAAIVFLAFQAASGQTVKRIQFAKGKSSAVIKGVTGDRGVIYVLNARSGQKLVITLTPARGVGIRVETDGTDGQNVLLREENGGTYEVGLEETGEYTILIGSNNNRSTPFTLTVKITKLADV
jgi:hypothetical protein